MKKMFSNAERETWKRDGKPHGCFGIILPTIQLSVVEALFYIVEGKSLGSVLVVESILSLTILFIFLYIPHTHKNEH